MKLKLINYEINIQVRTGDCLGRQIFLFVFFNKTTCVVLSDLTRATYSSLSR